MRSIEIFFFFLSPFLKGALEIGFEALNFFFLIKLFFVPLKIQYNSIRFNSTHFVSSREEKRGLTRKTSV